MHDDGVVVVGMACRYPDGPTPRALWETVLARRRAFRKIPSCRLALVAYEDSGDGDPDSTYVREAALLDDWVFDREQHRVSGSLYRAADLAHWLALDVAGDALEDAGFPEGDGLPRDRVGVILGNSLTGEFSRANALRLRWPYVKDVIRRALDRHDTHPTQRDAITADAEGLFKEAFPAPGDETLAGALANTIAGRICNYYDFHGTGFTVDAACASSLLAVIWACETLKRGDLDLVLAGGVDLSLDPFELVGFARLGALAKDEMRVYDANPTGFLPGEGAGVVALTTESLALAWGARVYARLIGWGSSSDGRGGLTRPEMAGQELALRRAYQHACISPSKVALIEGHGTGTLAGDEAELRALSRLLTDGRRAALGTVKANIGHTKAAAGIAGLIKATLAVHHQLIPPTTGCQTPHPLIAHPNSPVRVINEPEPWPADDRLAAVSSMGFGGINTHVVLQGVTPTRRHSLTAAEIGLARRPPDTEVIPLAAASSEQLARAAEAIAAEASELSRAQFTDLVARQCQEADAIAPPWRLAVVACDPDQAAARLLTAAKILAHGAVQRWDTKGGVFIASGEARRIGLLFSGQASPVRRDPGALANLLPEVEELFRNPLDGEAGITDTSVAQPAIVRASVAGLRWLARLGVSAAAAVGHSLGEISALHWAGALDEQDTLALARIRGRYMSELGERNGAMASLSANADEARSFVEGTSAVIAAYNGAEQTAVSGSRADIEAVMARAHSARRSAVILPVSHAFHSPAMAAAAAALHGHLGSVALRALDAVVISSVTGDLLRPDADLVELLTGQLTAPVQFAKALQRLLADTDVLVEVGPGQVLSNLARAATGAPCLTLDVTSQSAADLAASTAALFAAGAAPRIGAWTDSRFSRQLDRDVSRSFLVNPCSVTTDGGRPFNEGTNTSAGRSPVVFARQLGDTGETPAQRDNRNAAAPPYDVSTTAVAELAHELELDADAIAPQATLLGDLHLNSLRIAQLATRIAARLSRQAPIVPPSVAGATVADLINLIEALPPLDDAPVNVAAGVAVWYRAFADDLVSDLDEPTNYQLRVPRWELIRPADHPLAACLDATFRPGDGPEMVVLALPQGGRGYPDVELILEALRRVVRRGIPLVIVNHDGVGAAVARSAHVEHPDLPVMVVETPATEAGIRAVPGIAVRRSAMFADLVVDEAGKVARRCIRQVSLAEVNARAIALNSTSVTLVTGGAKGIGAECAIALARATGTTVALVGRSDPDDPNILGTLGRFAAARLTARYYQCDVANAATTYDVVKQIERDLGQIRGIIHAAGVNDPAPVESLTAEQLTHTLAPKVDGLRNLLATAAGQTARVVVTFGSVIARVGLPGEAHYAIANEWLARQAESMSRARPRQRWVNIAWSVWSSSGMGERLGIVDTLVRSGIQPIPPDVGVDLFLQVLSTVDAPPNVMVTGRLPASPTLQYHPSVPPLLRFLETPRFFVPGVEIVTDAHVSPGSDPYLEDHVIDGVRVFPTVMALEFAAQAVTAVTPGALPTTFDDVELLRPLVIPDDGVTLRAAALIRSDGTAEVVIRSEETGFASDHIRATCEFAAADPLAPADPGSPPRVHVYYGTLFFHGPRFARLLHYDEVSAGRCSALVAGGCTSSWFAPVHSGRLLLRDAGSRDALIHVLQACVPHRRVVPVRVERINLYAPLVDDFQVVATERSQAQESSVGEFIYDVTAVGPGGDILEEWRGLRLHSIGDVVTLPTQFPIELFPAYVARRCRSLLGDQGLDLIASTGNRSDTDLSVRLIRRLRPDVTVQRTPDGRLTAAGSQVCATHLDEHVLVVAASRPVAVDWELVPAADRCPLPSGPQAVAVQLSRDLGESPPHAETRIWTVCEVLAKLGFPAATTPLVIERRRDARWVVLHAGNIRVASVISSLEGITDPVALAVGVLG